MFLNYRKPLNPFNILTTDHSYTWGRSGPPTSVPGDVRDSPSHREASLGYREASLTSSEGVSHGEASDYLSEIAQLGK